MRRHTLFSDFPLLASPSPNFSYFYPRLFFFFSKQSRLQVEFPLAIAGFLIFGYC